MEIFYKYRVTICDSNSLIKRKKFETLSKIRREEPPHNGRRYTLEMRYKYLPFVYKPICMSFEMDGGWANMIEKCLKDESWH